MKILELRFKNLNSLYGEWKIDFTNPEYTGNGIFALTGPTGSGKSTILDAICLALYGNTPRLGDITKSSNEIMSRGTGECYAEVVFESKAGRFRCHWEQRRANKKPGAKLQDAEQSVSIDPSGEIIENKKSLIENVIVEKTGMDYDRFTRSILLSQGNFDEFLKANANEKSAILEQITGTEIYSKISAQVFERQKKENEILNNIKNKLEEIKILSPEEENTVEAELDEMRAQEKSASNETTAAEKAIEWLKEITSLYGEIEQVNENLKTLSKQVEDFIPEQEKLKAAERAGRLDADFAGLEASRKQLKNVQDTRAANRAELPDIEKNSKEADAELLDAELKTEAIKEEKDRIFALINEVIILDTKIDENNKSAKEIEKTLDSISKEIEQEKNEVSTKENQLETVNFRLTDAEKYLSENQSDEWLVENLTGLEKQLESLGKMRAEIEKKHSEVSKIEKELKNTESKLSEADKKQISCNTILQQHKDEIQQENEKLSEILNGRLLREYRDEFESLQREIILLNKISELEEQRKQLEDGRPCPLCGSEDHPYARGNVPSLNEAEKREAVVSKIIKDAEKIEEVIKNLEAKQKQSEKDFKDAEILQINEGYNKKSFEEQIKIFRADIGNKSSQYESEKIAVTEKLNPLGISEITEDLIPDLYNSLKNRRKKWQEFTAEVNECNAKQDRLKSEIDNLIELIRKSTNSLNENRSKAAEILAVIKDLKEQRYSKFGDKDTSEEKERVSQMLKEAESALQTAKTATESIKEKFVTIKANIEALDKKISLITEELKTKENDFLQKLSSAGFEDEHSFIKSRLSAEERERISDKAGELKNRELELKTILNEKQKILKQNLAKKLTDKSIEELEIEVGNLKTRLEALRSQVIISSAKLRQNKENRERFEIVKNAFDAQVKECRKWDELNSLVGSQDGKKYRAFAQGLTFESLVGHANTNLKTMSDRYLLVKDKELGLNVIDNYQAGEIRPVKNLSGGETFIVSLALALGLSGMSSKNVRVDSLFLDEGFGSLDEDALDKAVEALSGIQQQGKLIGLISHVSALKERIGTQIKITPSAGGRSNLSGPGCEALKT